MLVMQRLRTLSRVMLLLLGWLGPQTPHLPPQTYAAVNAPAVPDAAPDIAPDLVPIVIWSPTNPSVGDTLVITLGVRNASSVTTTAKNIETRFYFGLPVTPSLSTPPSYLYSSGDLALLPEQTYVIVLAGVFAVTSTQDVPVWVWADATQREAESNEGNNLIRMDIHPSQPNQTDSHEPDNACMQAKQILMNTPQSHTLWPQGDEDWVTFQVDGNRDYVIQALALGADAQPSLELHLDCNAPTSISASPNFSGTSVTWHADASGTAYVRVSQLSGYYGPNMGYTLSVTPQEACYSEPNNICRASTPMIVGNGATRQGNFCVVGDRDWYSFAVRAGASYDIDVTSQTPGVQPHILQMENDTCAEAPQFGSDTHQTYLADRDGFAHVLISNTNATPAGFGPNSNYAIAVKVSGCAQDKQEQNDSSANAISITVNADALPLNGCPAKDQDWFAFVAQPNTPYFIETLPSAVDEMHSDTQLSVFAADGTTLLAQDDDSGPGLGARVQVSVTQPTRLLVRVNQYDDKIAGPGTAYALSVRTTPCQTDAHEPNDTASTATALISGTASANTLCPFNDTDWFSFSVPAGTYSLATSDLGAAADTTLALYDASGTTQILFNDDYAAKGLGSRLVFSTTTAQRYRALVLPRATNNVSSGVQYSLSLQADSPLAPTTISPDGVLLNPPPVTSQINTLIVTNRARLAALYGDAQADSVMASLDSLRNHSSVSGEVIDVDTNPTIKAAYTDWADNLNSTEYANAVARTISNMVIESISQRPSIQNLILVGDDRVVPFHRLRDESSRFPESTYTHTQNLSPTGSAPSGGYFLTDDCFSAARLVAVPKQPWCVPVLATGRLVESPNEINQFIARFLSNSTIKLTAPNLALVGGYDFVQDTAQDICDKLGNRFGKANVNCDLIGNLTSITKQRQLQFSTNPPFTLQSFNGHGNHFALGVNSNNDAVTASEVASASSIAPEIGLVWSPACHIGLNVPPGAASNPGTELDFPQAYLQRGTNLIANTGYGWGANGSTAYSEYMVQYLTDAFVTVNASNDVQIGQALRRAKWKYFAQQHGEDVLHPKIAMQMVLYGLPMFRLQSGNATLRPEGIAADDDAFPSMTTNSTAPVSFGANQVISSSELIRLTAQAGFSEISDARGTRFALDGRMNVELGQSIQPRFYYALARPEPNHLARGAWIVSATYQTRNTLTPTLAEATNEFGTTQLASDSGAWDNSDLATVRSLPTQDTFVALMGQANRDTHQMRLTNALSATVYYGNYEDRAAPQLMSVSIARVGALHTLKIKADDSSGVQRVGVLFTNGLGEWHSQDMAFDVASHSWLGSVVAPGEVAFAVQILDAAGNVGRFTNKGRYYLGGTSSGSAVYLPVLLR